jgi:hypothetical protein
MAKTAFNMKKILFTSKLDIKLRNKLVKLYIWSTTLSCAFKVDTSGGRSEKPGEFLNVVLEKDGEDHLHRSCEK